MAINFIDFLKNEIYNATPETIKLSKGNIVKAVEVIRRHQDELKLRLAVENMEKLKKIDEKKKVGNNG